jgi:uncharacterized protein RhaS with RHS repeats
MLYRERYYDVEFGRFINRDPVEYWADDVNIYRYVFNNSLSFLDPLGLNPGTLVACAGAAAACDGPFPFGDVVGCVLLVLAADEAIQMARDHSKNEKHGDGGRANDSIQRQIDALNAQIKELAKQPGNSRIIDQLLQKSKI